MTEYCAVIGTHSTVRGDKLLYGQIPDPFPRCGIGAGHARLVYLVVILPHEVTPIESQLLPWVCYRGSASMPQIRELEGRSRTRSRAPSLCMTLCKVVLLLFSVREGFLCILKNIEQSGHTHDIPTCIFVVSIMSRHLSWLDHTGTTETIVVLNNSVLH